MAETQQERRNRQVAERKAHRDELERKRQDRMNEKRAKNATRDLERAGYDVVATRRRGR